MRIVHRRLLARQDESKTWPSRKAAEVQEHPYVKMDGSWDAIDQGNLSPSQIE